MYATLQELAGVPNSLAFAFSKAHDTTTDRIINPISHTHTQAPRTRTWDVCSRAFNLVQYRSRHGISPSSTTTIGEKRVFLPQYHAWAWEILTENNFRFPQMETAHTRTV